MHLVTPRSGSSRRLKVKNKLISQNEDAHTDEDNDGQTNQNVLTNVNEATFLGNGDDNTQSFSSDFRNSSSDDEVDHDN